MSSPPANPQPRTEAALGDADALHLRRAIALSAVAGQAGSRPFGAVIVSAAGEVLAEARNDTAEGSGCTGHAEVNSLRLASPAQPREVLAAATMYASGEPCVMCAGAIFWSGIRRVVFGLDAERLRDFRRLQPHAADLEMSCRDVFAHTTDRFDVVGPALISEATAPHTAFWAKT